jgi:beta-galactosidase/beta-glucuronidase
LNFEAVDYRCQVWVNGIEVGSHTGGNNPFTFDITDAARSGENEMVVRVDDTTGGSQLRGKQTLKAGGIWYTRVSGIWQTVWLEKVPDQHIVDLKISTDPTAGTITIVPKLAVGSAESQKMEVKFSDSSQLADLERTAGGEFIARFDAPKLWTPDTPFLYEFTVAVLDNGGQVIDQIESYAGIRSVGKTRDADGHLRFTLNGKTIFHFGPLDQGWWPDGLLTPPSDEAMLFDIQYLKAAGFNMIRKHIKVEPRRYYYHCDRIGMMMWQDQVSGGLNPPWTRLRPNPKDAVWSDADHDQFMMELDEMISSLENHPSIVVWVPFNEAWGQHRTVEVGRWTSKRDPTRLVNIASGGNFWPAGDVVDHHNYPHPDFKFDRDRYADFLKVIGEFGGHGYAVKDHLWDASRGNWGYGGLPKNKAEYKQRYAESLRRLNEFRKQGIAAGVYTQTTDVEVEINGLMTYDRKVIKIPADELKQLHRVLY